MPNRPSIFQTYKAPIAVLLALALALGTVAYRRISVALFPEVTFPKVKVIADNGLQPVDRMMVTVTKPMEDAIKRVPGLKLLRSTTIGLPGLERGRGQEPEPHRVAPEPDSGRPAAHR
ncbi:hypothetical protein GCM10027594_35940 [Hymenobacter agri]